MRMRAWGTLSTTALVCGMLWSAASSAQAAEWWEKLKLSGDLRYRHESSQIENTADRDMQRLRARGYLSAQVNEQVNATLGLAASTSAISANVSEGDSFSRKALGLELAYLEYKVMPDLNLYFGKMRNFFEKPGNSQLLWNGDINPEGIGGAASTEVMKDLKAYLNGAGFWVAENKSTVDPMLFVGQIGIKTSIENLVKVNLGVGYEFYQNILGAPVFVDPTASYGNSVRGVTSVNNGVTTTTNFYTQEYKIAEALLDLSSDAAGIPLRLFADYAVNGQLQENYRAYLIGLSVSKCKEVGSWDLCYNYRWVEKDAVVGAFADPHHGSGQTNAYGHQITVSYVPLANVKTSLNYYLDSKNIAAPTFFRRLQADIQTTF